MRHVIELYSLEETEKLRKKYKTQKAITAAFIFAALAVCVALLLATNTANAKAMNIAVIVVSGVCGCAAIYASTFVVAASKSEYTHASAILSGERTAHKGKLTLDRAEIKIPRSITVKKVFLRGENEETRFSINLNKANNLPQTNDTMTIYTVNGYVAAYEKNDEKDD